MPRSLTWTCLLVLVLSSSACRQVIVAEPEETALEDRTWTLDRVEQFGNVLEPSSNETYSIFLQNDGAATGRADCNECVGSYFFRKDDALVLSLDCTESACGPSGSSIPGFSILSNGTFDHAIEASTLTLVKHSSGGGLRLIFTAETSF